MASVKTTIGWGMPWLEYENLTVLDCEAHETREATELAFRDADPSVFTIDKAEYDRLFYGMETPRAIYHTLDALHSNYLIKSEDVFVKGAPSELYQIIDVSDDESQNHIVFYPDCWNARRWKRSGDDIDTALLHRWEKGSTRDYDPDGSPSVNYVGYGHAQWNTALMTLAGKPVDWPGPAAARKRDDLVPRVPLEMRWYLTRLGILDESGVNKLRPLTARWIG